MTPVEFQFNYPDGRPIAGMEFVIKLPKSGFIKEADGIIMPADLTFETDEQGFALVLLAPSSSVYTVRMTTPGQSEDYDSCRKGVSYKFYVPDSAEPVRAQDLFLAPPPNSEPWDETAIRELTEAKVIAVQSAETAVAASVSAEAAAVRAEAASAGIDEDANRAERARDASEAFAIDALAARTETDADRIAAQQAALDAGNAADTKVRQFEERLKTPIGGSLSGYEQRNVAARLAEHISIADLGAVPETADAGPAIIAAKLKGVPIVVPMGNFKITSDMSFTGPGVEFYPGASIEIPTGVVLTIDAPLRALPTFIFKGEGVVVFTRKARLKEAYLEWWGGSGDSAVVVDNQQPFIKTLRSVGYSSTALSVIQLLSGQYQCGGPIPLAAGGVCIRGIRPVDTYLSAASAGASRIGSIGTWTGYLFDAVNNGTVKGGLRFENFFVSVSTSQRQGIWRLGTEVRSPMLSHIGAVGAGLHILKSEAPITQIEGGYWNNGYMLEVDLEGNPLTDFVGVVELYGADWVIERAHIGHDNMTSGSLGFVAALYAKVGAGSGRCTNTVLEQCDVPLICAANDCLFVNLRPELAGKEAMIVSGNNNTFTNTKVGIQVSARAAGTYDAIRVSGGGNSVLGVNNDITTGSCLNLVHDTRGFTSDSMNFYTGLPNGRPNMEKPYSNITEQVLRADGICSLTPAQGISLYVNLETRNVVNADNVTTIHGRRPLTPITRIENGVPGQTVTLLLNQGSTTYKHSDMATGGTGNLWLLTKADTITTTMTPITFVKMTDGIWYQTK